MGNLGFPEIILLVGLVGVLAFEIVMLIDVWRSAATMGNKILWTVLTLFLNPLAAIFYFFVRKKR